MKFHFYYYISSFPISNSIYSWQITGRTWLQSRRQRWDCLHLYITRRIVQNTKQIKLISTIITLFSFSERVISSDIYKPKLWCSLSPVYTYKLGRRYWFPLEKNIRLMSHSLYDPSRRLFLDDIIALQQRFPFYRVMAWETRDKKENPSLSS